MPKLISLLLCFLLCACSSKEPEEIVQPDRNGSTTLEQVKPGDSRPFRLKGGDMFLSTIQGDNSADEMYGTCEPRLTLVSYRGQTSRELGPLNPYGDRIRLNGVLPGTYFVSLKVSHSYCSYFIEFTAAQ